MDLYGSATDCKLVAADEHGIAVEVEGMGSDLKVPWDKLTAARFYGVATLHKSGPVYEEVWQRLIQPEKDRDPQKKGFAVLIKVERAEDLAGDPLDQLS